MQTAEAILPDSASELALFLKSLAEVGRPVVSGSPLVADHGDAVDALRQMDAHRRDELVMEAPSFSAGAALWAARLFYHFCQFTVYRDIPEDQITTTCLVTCPEPRGPETDWSADLVLHHLPVLFQFARHLSNADPLLQQMKQIAAVWPLSSVGIVGLGNLPLNSFVGHPVLARLYADRIIAAADTSRLGDPRIDDLLRADLGIHRELAPVIAAKLFETKYDTD